MLTKCYWSAMLVSRAVQNVDMCVLSKTLNLAFEPDYAGSSRQRLSIQKNNDTIHNYFSDIDV